ncbi:MAG: class III signal peptide-containing protein [Candidatus Micrarchaeia archaeon]|jgi:uncharacterized protein (UPF0333 family)
MAKRGQTAAEYILLVTASVVFVSLVAFFVKQGVSGGQ